MKVVIVGAGVAGLAAARGLAGAGHEVEVYEQAPALRTAGGSVTIWSGGTGILHALGADLSGVGRRVDSMETWTHDGRRLGAVDLSAVARRYGAPNVHLPRQRLVERLAAGLPGGVLRFGARCVRVDPERGEVELACGSTVRGDVVVGADGRFSTVRDRLWGGDPARVTPWVTWQGYVTAPAELVSSHRILLIVGPEGMCGLTPAGEGLLLWWFDHRRDDPPAGPGRTLAERFGGWSSPVPEVLAAIDGRIARFSHYHHRVPTVWGRGRATLAGDAAHSVPPAMAQGANQGLEDGWALARELDGPGPVPDRLRRYERVRSRRMALVAALAGTEMTSDHRRHGRLIRLVPDALLTTAYAAWLRWTSTYLAAARRAVPAPGPAGVRGGCDASTLPHKDF